MKLYFSFIALFINFLSLSQTVSNISALSSYTGGTSVYVEGYYSPGDGGGGHFYKIDSSIITNGGTVFIDSTNSNKRWIRIIDDGKVNVKWFGAIANDNIDDYNTIYEAKLYANDNNLKLYFPSGTYDFDGNFIDFDQKIEVFGDGQSTILKGYGFGGSIMKVSGSNVNISKISIQSTQGQTVGITISNNSTDIILNEMFFFNKLDEAIRLYNCSNIKISNCHFNNLKGNISGYQIIQHQGFSSNNVSIIGNFSTNCQNDFVELNSESSAYSKNWIISNNTVKNVGLNGGSNESRFIGVTNTDGIIISNNIFENCYGDSAFHFEGLTGNVIISNNTIKNPNSNQSTEHGGSLIFNVSANSSPTSDKERVIIFENNIVELDSNYNTNCKRLIYSLNEDTTTFQILNNKFYNNSQYNDIKFISKGLSNRLWNIKNNEFYNFNKVIEILQNSSHTNIIDNSFYNCYSSILISDASTYNNSLRVEGNLFKNVKKVLESSYDAKINLLSFQGNTIDNSDFSFNIREDFLNGFKNNTFLNGSTTTYNDKSIKLGVINGMNSIIFDFKANEYTYLCWVDIVSATNNANRSKCLLRVSRNQIDPSSFNNYVAIIDQTRNGNWPLPVFTVDGNGLRATITGSSNSEFDVKVNIIDINGFLHPNEQSLGYSSTLTTAPVAKTASNNVFDNFENTIEYNDFINAYPNPVKDILKLESNNIVDNIKIYDLNGKLIKDISDAKSIKEINLSSLPNGLYIGIFQTSKTKVVKKIIKE